MAKEVAESKKLAPGIQVMYPPPALIISLSSCPSGGLGPAPKSPFSDWKITLIPSGM